MSETTKQELAGVLVQLRRRVGAHFEAAVTRTPAAFACRAGCESCCHQRFGVFEVEAAPVRRALAELAARDPALRRRVREQADDPAHADRCALLVDGLCAVYEARPMICRTHGLPILVRDEDGTEDGSTATDSLRVDHCPLNFREHAPPSESVLRLAAVNEPLVVLARLWDGGQRVELSELARADDVADGEDAESKEFPIVRKNS